MGKPTGISWLELAFSFVLTQGSWLPSVRADDTGTKGVIKPGTLAQAKECGTTMVEQAANLSKVPH